MAKQNKRASALSRAASSLEKDGLRRPGRTEPEILPTGLVKFDEALGGGLVRGRIYEVAGSEQRGKTTLALEICRIVQEVLGLAVVYSDYEHALEFDYAKRVGVNMSKDKFLFEQPDVLEDGLYVGRKFIESAGVGVSVLDSVAGMIPQSEHDNKGGTAAVARAFGPELRKYVALLAKTQTIGIFVNQTRTTFKNWMAAETTPGGKALKFFASVRMFCYGGKSSVEPWRKIGGLRSKMYIKKNKILGGGRGSAEYEILPDRGIVKEYEILEIAKKKELITERLGIYTLGSRKFRGLDTILEVMKNEEVREWILEA